MKKKIPMIVLLAPMVGLFMAAEAMAGSLDSPAAPTNPDSAMFTLEDFYQKLNTRTNVTKRTGAFTEPTGGPTNGTMHTLNDIMSMMTNRPPVTRTGQTNSYLTGDDGTYQKGGSWPNPRFTVQSTNTPGSPDDRTNCVVDNLTGLMWARNANLASNSFISVNGTCTWANAFNVITNSAGPVNGANYGGYGDWRLPNIRELQSLVDFGRVNPALPTGHPFRGVLSSYYLTSTTYVEISANAWAMSLNNGDMAITTKLTAYYVWPVRGGEN